MKKAYFSLLGLLILAIVPAHAQWVLLTDVEKTSVQEVDIIGFTTADYDDYIFVVENLAPYNTAFDITMQVGVNDGVNPTNWLSSYAGGVSTMAAGQTSIVSTVATYMGIPVTNVAASAASFCGDLRISNTGVDDIFSSNSSFGPVAIYGQGLFGLTNTGFISGTLNGEGVINSVRFVSTDPSAGSNAISSASIKVYGLTQTSP